MRSDGSPTDTSPGRPFGILVVCTGNICRSPLAERLGRAFLDETAGAEAADLGIGSAGTRAVVGSGMHPHSAEVLRGLGGDPADFRARQVTRELLVAADLTLTLTRAHRQEVLALDPRGLSRTFTLLEARDLLGSVTDDLPPSGPDAGEAQRSLVRRLHAARSRRRGGPADDVRDPVDGPLEVHQEVGDLISEALLPLLTRFLRAAGVAGPDGAGDHLTVVGDAGR
ncbi:protein-tyrosine phosphatase [Geodermatophilus saharensis]|uniref:Protein-tyrosine phosphatase n=1 Tax=Geodermatophilus saharensis TaxID=1137994 RepID=A0A239IA97_9ACTN|nr:hypothetical protein [Geodermatophilus saharensis]SNS90505.1 protein-tyrosine phosphatase [Geodermatophilus saharensis]